MSDHSVFWVCPILLFIVTVFCSGLAAAAKKDDPFLGVAMLFAGFCFHLLHIFSKDSLNSIFHGGTQHMGYYQCLFVYGTTVEIFFNFCLLILGIIIYIFYFLVFVGLISLDEKS